MARKLSQPLSDEDVDLLGGDVAADLLKNASSARRSTQGSFESKAEDYLDDLIPRLGKEPVSISVSLEDYLSRLVLFNLKMLATRHRY